MIWCLSDIHKIPPFGTLGIKTHMGYNVVTYRLVAPLRPAPTALGQGFGYLPTDLAAYDARSAHVLRSSSQGTGNRIEENRGRRASYSAEEEDAQERC